MAESIVNKRTQPFGGGVKPSSNATLHERIRTFFESLKWMRHTALVAVSFASLVKNKMLNIVDFIKSLFIKCFSMTYLTKAVAFTLAETLVVMGIIGVVAALTIPNLNQSTGDREKVAKVKKIYANLEDALGRATAVYGPFDVLFQTDTTDAAKANRFGERMTEFMKVSKNCKMEVNQGCLSSAKIKWINGTEEACYDADNTFYKFITADGISVAFNSNGFALVDIDGPTKGPAQFGKDTFLFLLEDNNFVPFRRDFSLCLTDLSLAFVYCAFGWVIDYCNMDYLKLSEDIKCPNGTTPTEKNPRCN